MILRYLLPAAVWLPAVLLAQDDPREQLRLKRPKLSPALDLLPAGSTLKDVRIPRYDEMKRPSALLRAELLRVVTEDHVAGENIELFIFAPTGEQQLRVEVGKIDYTVSRGILEARRKLTLMGEGFSASGSGAVFQLDSRRGFLHPPVTTTFEVDPRKLLSAVPPDPLPSLLAVASLLVSAPEPLTPAALERHATLARSESGQVRAEVAPTREMITRSEQLSQAASLGFQTFAHDIRRPGLLRRAGAVTVQAEAPKRNPGGIHVTCDGGMYFDAEKGHIVYLKNIVVTEPRFTFKCNGELKIILARKEGVDEELTGPEAFGDVQNIIATGGVTVTRKDPKGKDVVATAETASFDAASGDMVLRGGFPTVTQGKNYIRALEPGLYIRLYENGHAYCQPGKWETDVALDEFEELRKKEK